MAYDPAGPDTSAAFATLAGRRFALSARTPREILVPLLTPVLFALIIAPALAKTVAGPVGGIDYMTYVAISTVGLLVPLSCMFAGIGVIVDRETGARRDLLAAPIPRALLVVGNLAVALFVAGLQVVVLVGAAAVRGAEFTVTADGVAWFVGATTLFAVTMYGAAEILANRVASQEEYVGALPAIAIVPWFVAGSLFPLDTLPAWLAALAKLLPLTHALALMRYGLTDSSVGLHQIWGMSDPATMAALSLAVVGLFAAVSMTAAVRVFGRAAVQ